MKRIIHVLSWIGVVFLIIGATSCSLQFLTPGGGGDSRVPTNPDAPSNTDGAETILIPAGTFQMGSDDNDALADDDEHPLHEVTLNGFYIYTHEVTNAMYADCVAAGGCSEITVLESGPTRHYGDPTYAEYPVTGVDWNMADAYCKWAGGRMATEAEWERAARGSERLIYPWGSEDADCDRTNLLGCSIPPDTVEVGNYLLGNSPEGVWDMAGNVWEWVNDWYDEDTYFFSSSWNPLGPYAPEDPDHLLKVVRGGGLYSEPVQLRGATRTGINPYRVYDDVGFRCVADGSGMPTGYVPTDERHERVPPGEPDGGGETVDDPDSFTPPWWIEEYFVRVSCPDDEGYLHVYVGVDATPGTVFNLRVDGSEDWFTCFYDEDTNILECWGTPPPGYLSMDSVVVSYRASEPGGSIFHGYSSIVPVPDDCGSGPFTVRHIALYVECPVDGLFTMTIVTEPEGTWDTVRLSGVDLACVEISGAETRCTAPDIRTGDHYEFYLHGMNESGEVIETEYWVPVRTDCLDIMDVLVVGPLCFENHPTVQIMHNPEGPGIESVVVEGNVLDCVAMAPGVLICGDLTQPHGTEVEVEINFATGNMSVATITAPGCPVDFAPAASIEPYCYPPEAEEPAVSIHYWPFDRHIVSAEAGDTEIHCTDWGGGWYVCPGVPGAVGTRIDITACLEDGICFSDEMVIPDCGEILEGGWRISSIGCHDATHIYFQIDTGLAWLIPGADFMYSASDGETTYTCAVNPSTPGRIYCAGLRPEVPGPLEFCIQHAGDPAPTCQTYLNFNTWVGGIPPCAPEEVPEEPHVPGCADYTDEYTCGGLHKGECVWISEEPEHCVDAP